MSNSLQARKLGQHCTKWHLLLNCVYLCCLICKHVLWLFKYLITVLTKIVANLEKVPVRVAHMHLFITRVDQITVCDNDRHLSVQCFDYRVCSSYILLHSIVLITSLIIRLNYQLISPHYGQFECNLCNNSEVYTQANRSHTNLFPLYVTQIYNAAKQCCMETVKQFSHVWLSLWSC